MNETLTDSGNEEKRDFEYYPDDVFSNTEEEPNSSSVSNESNNTINKVIKLITKERLYSSQITEINVFDVASYILSKLGVITTMKLHKLLYYCQAWSLVWDDSPLFFDKIEAWANGPVIPDLFLIHKGQFNISSIMLGNQDKLTPVQIETIDSVINYYGSKPAQWLVDLTHNEDPWRDARIGLSGNDKGNREITLDSMYEYYSSLT